MEDEKSLYDPGTDLAEVVEQVEENRRANEVRKIRETDLAVARKISDEAGYARPSGGTRGAQDRREDRVDGQQYDEYDDGAREAI